MSPVPPRSADEKRASLRLISPAAGLYKLGLLLYGAGRWVSVPQDTYRNKELTVSRCFARQKAPKYYTQNGAMQHLKDAGGMLVQLRSDPAPKPRMPGSAHVIARAISSSRMA